MGYNKAILEKSILIFFLALVTFALGLLVATSNNEPEIEESQRQLVRPINNSSVVIYDVTNVDGKDVGRITDKKIVEGHYTVVAGAYGEFLVTEEQYESLVVGDEIPEYLGQRGN